MKTEEDEAFDELAKRQGAWGGGFTAKRKMAADKLWDKPSVAFDEWWNGDNDESTNPFRLESGAYWAWAGWKAALAQPAQESERKALKLALEALDDPSVLNGINNAKFFITQALAQPPLLVQRQPLTGEQAKKIFRMARELEDTGRLTSLSEGAEREAFLQKNREIQCALEDYLRNITETTPPLPVQPVRPWVGLTEDEWSNLKCKSVEDVWIALTVQAKLKEKNNGT